MTHDTPCCVSRAYAVCVFSGLSHILWKSALISGKIFFFYKIKDVYLFIALQSTPTPRPFNPDHFLSTLESSGPQLTTGIKGDWEGLYRRFFRSVNFSSWFNSRYEEVSQKLSVLHMETIGDAVNLFNSIMNNLQA